MNFRRYILLSSAVLWLMPVISHAQVALQLALSDHQYLSHEQVVARLVLRNDSGRPLAFGDDQRLQGKLFFEITDSSGKMLQLRTNESPTLPQMILTNGQTSEPAYINLTKYYRLSEPGNYRIHFWISHPQMSSAYQSNNVNFSVNRGHELWRLPVGVPDLLNDDSGKPSKTMYYVLTSIYKKANNSLYIQIEDDQKIYALRYIGRAIGSEKVERDVDGFSNLHMVVPIKPRLFQYVILNLKGEIEKAEIYKKTNTPPRLGRDEKHGNVFIVGGEKAIPGIDFTQEATPTKADGTK